VDAVCTVLSHCAVENLGVDEVLLAMVKIRTAIEPLSQVSHCPKNLNRLGQ
jgi:hypothetical protein